MPRDPGALFQGYHFRPRMPCFDFYARCSKTSVQKAALLTLREWWEGADQKSKHSICKFWFWCNFTAEKAQLFSAPIHETSIFFVDMVMADIAIDGCVGSYWVLGLQALLLNWRDGYNLTFVFAICGRQTNTWLFQLWNHMMSHVITVHPSHTFNDVLSTVSWKQQMWFLDIWLKCCQKGCGLAVQFVNSTWSH